MEYELWLLQCLSSHSKMTNFTISAFTETGLEESSIVVPKQRVYKGRNPVITSRLADTPCATLGAKGLLYQLTRFGMLCGLDEPSHSSLVSLLEDCIKNDYDVGMAYSRLRRIRSTNKDWSTAQEELCRQEEEDREMRQKALIGNQIIKPWLPPRRVWDLYSNRVVPYWVMGIDSLPSLRAEPISHAWVDKKDRTAVWTSINGNEWPVPIPKDVDLNLIRIEMLNLGLEYAWLDVLCLRQAGGRREDLRAEEWKVDVPTIGAVYCSYNVVIYLSGLGRPLMLKEGHLESDRCWFRRAWTLQEAGYKRVIAGDTSDGPLHATHEDGKYETKLLTRFHKQLESTCKRKYWVRDALDEMRKRVSSNPVDKIAGLVFLMWPDTIPTYYESASLEEAWTALVNSMSGKCRAQLFFVCPEPGNTGKKWRPSWDQIMTNPLLACSLDPEVNVDRDDTGDEEWCNVRCVVGLVRGLAVVEGRHRRGALIVADDGGREEQFMITAPHTYPIPEDTYTLIYTGKFLHSWRHCWVVGRSLPGRKFEKVSVLEISGEEQRRLKDAYISDCYRYILI